MRFRPVRAPTKAELTKLTNTIARRVAGYLERQGLLERDTGNIYLTPDAMDASDEDPSNQLLGSSITYRIAVGPQRGRKVFTLQTLPDCESDNPISCSVGEAGEAAGFSLHAGVAAKANERAKLERLCRYITRPAVSTKRLSMTRNGRVRYELKTPWRNGTTHVLFEPLDFISRLVSLVVPPIYSSRSLWAAILTDKSLPFVGLKLVTAKLLNKILMPNKFLNHELTNQI